MSAVIDELILQTVKDGKLATAIKIVRDTYSVGLQGAPAIVRKICLDAGHDFSDHPLLMRDLSAADLHRLYQIKGVLKTNDPVSKSFTTLVEIRNVIRNYKHIPESAAPYVVAEIEDLVEKGLK